ncbi:MAG TPA: LuxR C-terminal-related transcriptional regulator, partial [Symbiobacteriaceae bacterium]|nr:LuxR C-terminal-related transcriptional regulator [Symbiobacteriaceae bacterium]
AADGMLQSGLGRTVLEWLALLPAERLMANPDLIATHAWALFLTGKVPSMEEVSTVTTGRAGGRLAALRAWLAHAGGRPDTPALARQALEMVSPQDTAYRPIALLLWGSVLVLQGKPAGAVPIFRDVYQLCRASGQPVTGHVALMNLAYTLADLGQVQTAIAFCREALAQEPPEQALPVSAMARVPLGVLLYQTGQLDEARACLENGLTLCRQAGVYVHMLGLSDQALARLQFAQGEPEAALTTIRQAHRAALGFGKPLIAAGLAAVEAELRLRQGDAAAAAQWVQSAHITVNDAVPPWYELPYLTLARVLLAEGRVGEVRPLLDRMAESFAASGRRGRLVTALVLKAVAAELAQAPAEAEQHLRAALQLAEPEAIRRPFLDEGPVALQVLSRVRPTGAPGSGGLVEPLSARELELLRLIAAGLSNEAIAERLFISLNTTKWHVRNVFGKLGVTSRTQAMVRARQLHLVE